MSCVIIGFKEYHRVGTGHRGNAALAQRQHYFYVRAGLPRILTLIILGLFILPPLIMHQMKGN